MLELNGIYCNLMKIKGFTEQFILTIKWERALKAILFHTAFQCNLIHFFLLSKSQKCCGHFLFKQGYNN